MKQNRRKYALVISALRMKRMAYLLGFTLLSIGCLQTAIQEAEPENDSLLSGPRASTGERFSDYDIVTVLPRDAIPAIDNPKFISVEEAYESYAEDELILGVEFNGDARAYSIPMLSSHEIVNDTVGGVKLAVTW